MGLIMNYKGLGEKYGKPKHKKQNKASKFAFGSMESFEAFECSKSVKNLLTKRKRKSSAKKRKKAAKELTYEEQLKHPMWLKKRDAVLDRYGHQCFRCGSTFNLNVHHLSYQKGKLAWEYPLSNFVVLCKDCHCKVHANKNDEYYPIYK